jgi:phosphate transport system protein
MEPREGQRQHISGQFNAELEQVKTAMLEMGGLVQQQVAAAVQALVDVESGEAEAVCAADDEINQMELAIDQACTRILARRQPAAGDLRLVLTVLKAINDLERIGDEAVKIARQAITLSEQGASPSGYRETRKIAKHVARMLNDALDAFARMDVDLAVAVVQEDQAVDREYAAAMRALIAYMTEDSRVVARVLNELWALRALERIGDHSRNISEYVIYMVRGMDLRHVSPADLQTRVEQPR